MFFTGDTGVFGIVNPVFEHAMVSTLITLGSINFSIA